MRKFTYIIFFTATIIALYCTYNQGVINERKRWQEIYYCEYDAKSDARLCMKTQDAIIQFNENRDAKSDLAGQCKDFMEHGGWESSGTCQGLVNKDVIPPSNIRAKVK